MKLPFHSFLRYSTITLILLSFSSCTLVPEPAKETKETRKNRPLKPAKATTAATAAYGLDSYVKQLSFTKLMLTDTSHGFDQIKPHLEIINGFSTQKHETPVFQPVIIISYSIKGKKGIQQVASPFMMTNDMTSFPDLEEIMALLSDKRFTVNDLHPFILANPPTYGVKIASAPTDETRRIISQELETILHSKASLSELDEARVQTDLLRFFIQHHMRDGAYLAAENARQALAAAEDSAGDKEKARQISTQLDTLESELHREMPFTLNAL